MRVQDRPPQHVARKSSTRFGSQGMIALIQIFVKLPTGEMIILEVEPETSVKNVKEKIKEEKGFPPDQQFLFFLGEELEDDHTLKDYDITNQSTLRLHLVKHIFVKMPSGKMISLEVEPETSIRRVKDKIEDKEGIPQDQQCLIFFGKELLDDCTLSHYKVPNEATLHVGSMRIYVLLPTGKATTLDVLPSDSVEIVKKKIYEKKGIALDQQRLTFDDKQLEDGCSLSDNNIHEESLLCLNQAARG
ncbi:hypothetical protein ACROYT_G036164 [Oculina patagonica]